MTKGYEHHKKWRKEHPQKRAAGKKRHYQKTQSAKNGYQRWTLEHSELIIAPDRPSDRELAKSLGRSMAAIQVRRSTLLAS